MLKKYFIEAKIYKLVESVIPHQILFQHQIGYVWPTGHGMLCPLQLKNLGRHVPSVPHKLRP